MGEHLVATGVHGNVSLQKAQGEALHEQTPVRRGQMLQRGGVSPLRMFYLHQK